MKASESSSASNSATTSASGPGKRDEVHASAASSTLSETEFLAKQADDARQAMGKAWSDIRHSLAHTGDVRVWTRQYPWVAAGTALAAGVAAGYLLTPRDRDEAREMWEKLKDQLHAAKGDAETVAAAPKSERAPKASLLGTILKEGIKLATPFITSVIGASMGGGAGRNGHDPSTEPPKSDGDHI